MLEVRRDESAGEWTSWIVRDRDGDPLDGGNHYRVVMDLTVRGSWWSIALYDDTGSLRPNAEERYAFTSFNVIPEDDGTIVLDIAAERPRTALNWLPCRPDENFCLAVRFYCSGSRPVSYVEEKDLPRVLRVTGRGF